MTREEQIDWLCRLRADLNNGVIFTPWNKEFTEALKDVLEQEPRKGRWIKGIEEDWNGEDEFIEEYLECDQCHYRYLDGSIAYNFCPNCGVDMRGEK